MYTLMFALAFLDYIYLWWYNQYWLFVCMKNIISNLAAAFDPFSCIFLTFYAKPAVKT